MLDSIGYGWAAFALVVIAVFFFCLVVVRYYTDRHEAEVLPTVVTVAALTLSLLALFLIPVDIMNVSIHAGAGSQIKALYYVLYSSILAFAFVVIPFTYFYYEEYDEDITLKQRIWGGLKYTIFLLLIFIILLIIGIFVKPGTPPNDSSIKDWATYISDANNGGESSIAFAVACLALIGFLVWITYTAYGLSAFPIGLLKGKRHVAEEASDIQADLETTREQTRAISSKYMTGKKMSSRDEKQFDLLKRQEKILARRSTRIDQSQKGFGKIAHACKPFVFVFGILLFLVTLLIFVSIVLTLVDKITNSCGAHCGFFAKYPKVPNPIDLLLWHLRDFFPMDYIVLGSLIAYIFFCTLSGIAKIGVRFLWVHLYSIKPRQTAPQGLLLTAILLMLALLVLNMEILTLAPQYASFGSQTWTNTTSNQTDLHCDITSPPDNCTMTQIGVFVARIQLGTSFFGNIYFYMMWIFVAAFIIGAIVTCVMRKQSNIDQGEESDEEDIA